MALVTIAWRPAWIATRVSWMSSIICALASSACDRAGGWANTGWTASPISNRQKAARIPLLLPICFPPLVVYARPARKNQTSGLFLWLDAVRPAPQDAQPVDGSIRPEIQGVLHVPPGIERFFVEEVRPAHSPV